MDKTKQIIMTDKKQTNQEATLQLASGASYWTETLVQLSDYIHTDFRKVQNITLTMLFSGLRCHVDLEADKIRLFHMRLQVM